jgi:hypothetical protein
VVLGIGDDAALLQVPVGRALVVTTDTLNAGVHFPDGTARRTSAGRRWRSTCPTWRRWARSPPGARCRCRCRKRTGLARRLPRRLPGAGGAHGVALVGGDTTRGPLSVCVTAHGLVEPGRALRRDGARAGDEVWVTGTLGDAAGALALLQQAAAVVAPVCEAAPLLPVASSGTRAALPSLRPRLDRPEPRVAAGEALAGLVHAAIDVSDGLLADLGGSTLPGSALRMPSGPSNGAARRPRRLDAAVARISASRRGRTDLRISERLRQRMKSRLSRPMPCSPESVPPSAIASANTRASASFARVDCAASSGSNRMLTCRLPLPAWPK